MPPVSVYTLNPSLQAILTSPDEVVFRGGQYDTFSVIVSTDELPVGSAEFVDLLTDGVDASDGLDGRLTGADADLLRDNLDRLVDLGVVRRTAPSVATDAWIGFRRFGTLPDGWARGSSFLIAGSGDLAGAITDLLATAGATVTTSALEAAALSESADDASSDATEPAVDGDGSDPADAGADVIVIAIGDGQSISAMHEFNKAAVDAGRRVLWIQGSGSTSIVGPYVIPGHSPCYWEWERTFARSMFEQDHYRAGRRPYAATPPAPLASRQMAVSCALPVLVELVTLGDLAEPAAVLMADAGEPSVSSEICLRVPRCPICATRRAAVRAVFP